MYDPIGGFKRMIDQFMVYLDTAYRIENPTVAAARHVLLSAPGELALDPIFEAVPRYVQWGHGIEELVADSEGRLEGFSKVQRRAFAELVLCGLFDSVADDSELGRKGSYKPYLHQMDMLRRGVADGLPGIVTSGTGSGKTESFLLPLLAQISREATSWPAPLQPLDDDWLDPRGRFKYHRRNEHPDRPKAMRAIVLYPLNALVEDQMVRLRKAVDSPEARAVMDQYFAGNRIFFGRYTGKSPVTGYLEHPRLADTPYWDKRSKRATGELRKELRRYREIQAKIGADPTLPDDLRYLFPSTDGGELISRWDMQATPPDILVTNQSILNAMLVREIDAPIIDQTRDWILREPSARFYLILDELHLVRGSAGAEMASLLRILIERLGLSHPDHAHKLRVLSSSASLPMEGADSAFSVQYLKSMFGNAGTAGSTDLDRAWRDSVVTGTTEVTPRPDHTPTSESLRAVADSVERGTSTPAGAGALLASILTASKTIEDTPASTDLEVLEQATKTAAAMLEFATQDPEVHGRRRPSSVGEIGTRLFGERDDDAVRGLLVLRAIPDLPTEVLPDYLRPRRSEISSLPSFRMHTFVRNVEGMFASVLPGPDKAPVWGAPSIERGVDYDTSMDGEKRRLFELLYCEACGELYVGGKRGESGRFISLLPAPEELEKLPEVAASLRFEDASYEEFAMFWPGGTEPINELRDDPAFRWNAAFLDSRTGLISPSELPDAVLGYSLHRRDAKDHHDRDRTTGGTAVPYCCPKCGTDYSGRYRAPNSLRREGRLSPIRSFRTGFSKTSQLLATELVAALKSQGGDGKLVAFSDSREDAANLALEVEVQHQTDLRREILISSAERLARERAFTAADERVLEQLSLDIKALMQRDLPEEEDALEAMVAKRKALRQKKEEGKYSPSLSLSELFEFNRGRAGDDVRPIVGGLLKIGALPVKGADTVLNRVQRQPWYRFFNERDGESFWKSDEPEPLHSLVGKARNWVEEQQKPEATDLLFSKTYFALEETGLGWPSFYGPSEYTAELSKKDAWLRLFADAYRLVPNEFQSEAKKNWNDARDMLGARRTGRLRHLMEKLFTDPAAAANEFLSQLGAELGQRTNGTIDVTRLFFRTANPDAPAWRCAKCGRVHLHRGLESCTRCGERLPTETALTAGLVSSGNFLGRRVMRSLETGGALFRLRCEELTGQTEDPATRLQQFKGVFVPDDGESENDFLLRKKFDEVDLISVTTTMEVGVDIGSLQAVYQGNMPPQRFNYQQRVGRAGRRGQAFSTVLTVCRSKSHDIHYFRNPLDMTGAAPPPPFITTGLVDIPSRLLRKFWLVEAFNKLRNDATDAWAGDDMVPGDIHGEFLYCHEYFDPNKTWPKLLHDALVETNPQYELFAGILARGARCDIDQLRNVVGVESVLADVEALRAEYSMQAIGIASALAERGLIPMYGMPTRSRNLYVELLWKRAQQDLALEWDTIDRDQDMAIFDFAPGSVRTREKLHHRSIGFTGPLPVPSQFTDDLTKPLEPYSSWFKDDFLLGYCDHCGTWTRSSFESIVCGGCGTDLAANARRCITPSGYRSDLRPSEDSIASKVGQRITLASLGKADETVESGNLRVNFAERSEVFIVNPGGRDDEGFTGFDVTPSIDLYAANLPFAPKKLQLSNQAIMTDVVLEAPTRWVGTGPSERAWLASPKITNSLQIGASVLNDRLRLNELDGGLSMGSRSPGRTSVRAAAISATEIVVQRAAFELDIAPEEFDALAPNAMPGKSGALLPYLQIADALPNGSGFCRHLLSDSSLPVTSLINSVLNDTAAWPRRVFDDRGHSDACGTSCYRCLQRYNNRNYHGLLDWRLGLSYLRSLVDQNHTCGLDGNYDAYELTDWRALADRSAADSATFIPRNSRSIVGSTLKLPAFSLSEGSDKWAVVVHPLWRREGLLSFLGLDDRYVPIDTFELARRPLLAIERARSQRTGSVGL
ncbi:DEAD/DEAH box helicase [Mesorhizobium sp. BR1-1-3]|uniref:DEAD/DEAH box helicase n=1 Tax=Mesorhizobium sp. BR1-1-3 TaxID=2876651 RepID=UPI001CD06053|nr:DEAD/DEAH box helicase [Mesorhizobium sp. BR1-1-3]MBZ9887318.1 DEAD/DEAH box helicase [Mesorhizobium sp. BR1-1-3]